MNGIARAGATLLGAAAAGVLLWLAAQIGRGSTGGYWAAYGVVAGAGLVFARHPAARPQRPPARRCSCSCSCRCSSSAGWVLLAMQPDENWFSTHVLSWSGDLGVRDVVRDVGTWIGVLAFGIGYVLGAALEPMPRRTEVVAPAAFDRAAADEPLTAERRETVEPSSPAARAGAAPVERRNGRSRARADAGSVTGSSHAKRSQT